ncbi:MAG: hypothetical protein IJ864_04430 [Alphaproteobacteria bacterium]|nr:hypothetical protein [Alphaproteobacteria bacterium]
MAKDEIRNAFKSHRSLFDKSMSALGKVATGALAIGGTAMAVGGAVRAVKHTADVISGKARPVPLYPWPSMAGLPGMLDFYARMSVLNDRFFYAVMRHPWAVRPRPLFHHVVPPFRDPHRGR